MFIIYVMNTVTLRKNGRITIPAEFRRKYGMKPGKTITLIDLEGGAFMISNKPSGLDELLSKMETDFKEAGITLDDMLEELDKVRTEYFQENYLLEKH